MYFRGQCNNLQDWFDYQVVLTRNEEAVSASGKY